MIFNSLFFCVNLAVFLAFKDEPSVGKEGTSVELCLNVTSTLLATETSLIVNVLLSDSDVASML